MSADVDNSPPARPVRRRPSIRRIALIAAGALALLLVLLVLVVRFGVLTPQGRNLIEARTDGLSIGRFGELGVEGVSGDLFSDLSIERLTISDEEGVWLEARDLRIVWEAGHLFQRRFDADLVTARLVRVLRRPTLEPGEPSEGAPIGVAIDALRARLELSPEFSYERGLYDVDGSLEMLRRNRGQSVELHARSLLHAGDGLDVRFSMGRRRPLVLVAEAREARGGAIAGALGLPSDRPFELDVRAGGQSSEGRFSARATSGAQTPLTASGAWSPDSLRAEGRLILTASELTRGLAERLGQTVTFQVAGFERQGDFIRLNGRVAAENLVVAFRGPVSLEDRRIGPAGLGVTVASDDLSPVTGQDLGGGRLQGVLRGDPDRWSFDGRLQARRISLAGYSLGEVAGPIEAGGRDGDISVETDLRGSGGAGQGYVAALLGGAPRLSLEAERLSDGRLVLRDLDAQGAGLRLEASGGRGLMGRLNFRGQATLSNLAAARAGAQGEVQARWSAAQPGAGRPWSFTLDAEGRRLALGFAELDRLLGASPDLRLRADWDDGRLAVEQAVLQGAELRAEAAGVMADGDLRFNLDWRASGPFRAGPVEISGQARGSGAITGAISSPKADLRAQVDEIDLPRLPLTNADITLTFQARDDGSSGRATLQAQSPYGPAAAATDFAFPAQGVNLSNLAVNAGGVLARGDVALRRGTPSSADLYVQVREGALLTRGEIEGSVDIVDRQGGAYADLSLTADDAAFRGSTLLVSGGRLTAQGPLARLPYDIEAQGRAPQGQFRLDGSGVFSAPPEGYVLAFSGEGALGRRELRTVEPAVIRITEDGRTARLRLATDDQGRIDLDARLVGGAADVDLAATGLGLGLVNEDLAGRVSATGSFQGRGGRLSGGLRARLDNARGRGAPESSGLDGVFNAELSGDDLVIDSAVTNDQGLRAEVDLTLPAEASADPFRVAVNRTRPMRGTFAAQGEVRPLWDLLVGGERILAGRVDAQGTIGGTLADPAVTGRAAIAEGRFEDGATGLVLTGVSLQASLAERLVNIRDFSGRDGSGGTVQGSGQISLLRNGASSFRLALDDFQVIDNDIAQASASGEATLNRNAEGQIRLAGALTITEAEVAADLPTPSGVVPMDVVEINRPPELDNLPDQPERAGPAVALDVSIDAPNEVFLRGRGLDLELALDAHVGGTTARPVLSGTARVVRGDYEFAGKRFEFDRQGVVYLATSPQDIRINLTAVREDPALTAVVRIRGTAAEPEITLTSTPELPSDEVLSQVLFGRSASQLSPLEAAQLASAISSLAGGGGFDVIGGLRTFAGLDRLALAGGDESGVTVSGGKYVTDDVYLELTGGGRGGPSASVEWRVRPNLAIISRLTGQGDTRLAVRWRRDY